MPQPAHRFTLGTFKCTVVSDGSSPVNFTKGLSFANATLEEVATALAGYIGPQELSFNSLVIDTGRERLLIDTGSGPGEKESELFDNLAAAGIAPASIDIVVITHAHGDHAGGVTDNDGNILFPNARFVLSRAEWQWWSVPDTGGASGDLVRHCLRAIDDRVRLVEPDEEITPGVAVVDVRGHTAGQIGLLITSENERLLHAADAVHHPIQFVHPHWYFPFDQNAAEAVATRRRLFSQAVGEGLLFQAYHFPFPGLGHVHADGTVWRWEPLPG